MYEYKNEILSSRVGCLGASDANTIATIANNGTVPNWAKKRLAIVKGLIEPKDNFTSEAMRLGDEIEMAIFENLKQEDERWQSNYLLESKKYSKKNVKLIAHIDFFLKDDERKVLRLIECKATKDTTLATQANYKNQLFVQQLLGKEYARELGRDWKVELSLCHYCTANHTMFDPDNITLKHVKIVHAPFDVELGMTIIDNYLEKPDVYYDDDEIDAELLPTNVKQQFDLMTTIIKEIDAQQKEVDEFKRKLYDFFLEKGIKSVKSDEFSITLVEPTTSVTFNSKAFLEEYSTQHPTLYKRLCKKYNRTSERKGFVKISIKKPKDNIV